MRSAAFSVIPKTVYTAIMIIAVLLFMASYVNAQQRKTIRKETTAISAKGRQQERITISRVKADLQLVKINKQPISVQLISDTLVSIPPFQPASDPLLRLICTVPGIMVMEDPCKPAFPLSILDFF